MLIDMHAHTSGISHCCRADAQTVLETAAKAGIDGLVLTNHYQEMYVTESGAGALAEKYAGEYRFTKKLADAMGIRLFFGIEVTAKRHANAHILVYGVRRNFCWNIRRYTTFRWRKCTRWYTMRAESWCRRIHSAAADMCWMCGIWTA